MEETMTALDKRPNMKLFALNSNDKLAQKISDKLGIELSSATVKRFSDDEIKISVDESVRGNEVYVIQSISDPVNTNLMELLIMVDALKRASAESINVVIPYYGYSRADRKARSREPITAKLVATFLELAGVNRVITLDLHADQIQGFFDIPVDHLRADRLLANYFKEKYSSDELVVVSADHTGVSRARRFAEILKAPIAIVDNRSPEDANNVPETVIGNVEGQKAIIIDDMIDTGIKISIASETLKKMGATNVFAVATHAVFSGNAVERLEKSPIEKILVSDSIEVDEDILDKLMVVSVGGLLGEAIELIHSQQSVAQLFGKK